MRMLGNWRRRPASASGLPSARPAMVLARACRSHMMQAPTAEPRREESNPMTYVVNEACIRCKYMDCVEVCPVDCFYEGENMLVIHPDECIDCGVCEPECPGEAIIPDSEPAAEQWLELNRQYAASWPNITRKKPYPADADEWKDVADKHDKFFSPNPGGT